MRDFLEQPLITPHNAYNTRDALFRMLSTVVENLRAFFGRRTQECGQ